MHLIRIPTLWAALALATAVSTQAGPGLDFWLRQTQRRTSSKTSTPADKKTVAATAAKENPRTAASSSNAKSGAATDAPKEKGDPRPAPAN